MGGTLGNWVQGAAVATALIGSLFAVALLAALAGLTKYGAGLFRVRIQFAEVALACLAQSTASSLIFYGLGPFLMRMTNGANPIVGNIMLAILLFGIPPLVLVICLQAAGRLSSEEGLSLSLWGYGTFTAALALLSLLLSVLMPDDVRAVPFLSVGFETFKNLIWLMLVIGGGLAFAGYSIGSKRKGNSAVADVRDEEEPLFAAPVNKQPAMAPVINASAPPSNQWLAVNGQQYPIYDGVEMTIGRVEQCAIRLTNDEEISRQHAVVRAASGRAVLQDKGSRNGTYLNNSRITTERVLQDGDEIRIGNTSLVFKSA